MREQPDAGDERKNGSESDAPLSCSRPVPEVVPVMSGA
jgi:hypothetical protein